MGNPVNTFEPTGWAMVKGNLDHQEFLVDMVMALHESRFRVVEPSSPNSWKTCDRCLYHDHNDIDMEDKDTDVQSTLVPVAANGTQLAICETAYPFGSCVANSQTAHT